MASLSTASRFAQDGGQRKLCISASSHTQATSPLPGRGGLRVSVLRELRPASSSRIRRLALFCVAASKRTSEKRKSVAEEPLQYEGEGADGDEDEEYALPELPGQQRDFWEGPQFEILGFILQYLWAIGIVVAIGGCIIAVRFYNEGATDFKETEVYKESMKSQGFLEVPSDSQVFDEPPSQDAPPVGQESSN